MVRGTSPGSQRWGSSQEGALSWCTRALLPAGCQAPDTSSWYWCFAPGIQSVIWYFCIPLDRNASWLENRNIPLCMCVLFFHVEMDSVSLRDLKIAYGNVFLLSCSFCSALHLLDFTFSTKRNSHYLFSENNILFLFSRASWTPCSPDQFKKGCSPKPTDKWIIFNDVTSSQLNKRIFFQGNTIFCYTEIKLLGLKNQKS